MTNEEIILKAKEEIRLRGLSPDTKPSYNSCRNRHSPKCQTLSRERWIDARKADLLNVGYFHVVFTVPQELNLQLMQPSSNATIFFFTALPKRYETSSKIIATNPSKSSANEVLKE